MSSLYTLTLSFNDITMKLIRALAVMTKHIGSYAYLCFTTREILDLKSQEPNLSQIVLLSPTSNTHINLMGWVPDPNCWRKCGICSIIRLSCKLVVSGQHYLMNCTISLPQKVTTCTALQKPFCACVRQCGRSLPPRHVRVFTHSM